MSFTELQSRILKLQESLASLQEDFGELTPNADEFLLAQMDAGQKAIDLVREILHKLG